MMIMGRAEVVDVLVSEGIVEPVAWNIAIRMSPQYLEDADALTVRSSVDNIVWEHLEKTGELDCATI
jgi:hypothetical protein